MGKIASSKNELTQLADKKIRELKCLKCKDEAYNAIIISNHRCIFGYCPHCKAGKEALKKYKQINKNFTKEIKNLLKDKRSENECG